jgi:hypothetical protein
MFEFLKQTMARLALENGLFLGRATDLTKVSELVRSLRPKSFDGSLVRIGPNGDGGYLIPDDIAGICACISPGVSTQCDFDVQIADRGIPVYLLDASVLGPPVQHDLFNFYPLFLGGRTIPGYTSLDDFCRENMAPSGW